MLSILRSCQFLSLGHPENLMNLFIESNLTEYSGPQDLTWFKYSFEVYPCQRGEKGLLALKQKNI